MQAHHSIVGSWPWPRRKRDLRVNDRLTEPPDIGTVYVEMRWMPPILVVLIVTALAGCNPGSSATAIAGGDDLNVLWAIVQSACASESKQVVSDLPLPPFQEMQSAKGGPIASFGSRVEMRAPREVRWPRGDICSSVRVVDDAVIKEVLSHETSIPPKWTFFRTRFDDARVLMRFSLPAYSADGRTAVVYADATCPYSCGMGVVYELHSADDKWAIVKSEGASRP